MDDSAGARIGDRLRAAVAHGSGPVAAADRLCCACVSVLHVSDAGVAMISGGASRGTFGVSGPLPRRLDELEFTYGDGPCLDAVRNNAPVFAEDLGDPAQTRWPAFRAAALTAGIRAVFAFPITVGAHPVGALGLFRYRSGPLRAAALAGAALAADLAGAALLELLAGDVDWDALACGDGDHRFGLLARVEVHQATGMIMARLNIGAEAALLRLRAHAYSHDMTADEVARDVVDRRLSLTDDRPDLPSPRGGQ